ncbi:hypothetical protein P3S72_12585 [Pseudomonas sp. D3]|uniref:hypothetical protein n=1 Tax=Pseudomonas sp. D3 TaxID=517398 RepID=UPI0023E3EB21|nr:hypothetical protein [Pseudomonas sp. D3]WET12926.1 hypothetical protein P3S72_12585 [Pseudomonas sp. D3]
MQATQRYLLTIHELFTITDGCTCGAEAVVAILDGGVEVDCVKFSGKCQSKGGYSRSYHGKSGLQAALVSGPGRIDFGLAQAAAI